MAAPFHLARSQPIFRLPVDRVPATMILHDGARSEIELFLPVGDSVPRVLTEAEPFVPVVRRDRVCLVARAAIAVVAVAEESNPIEAELPIMRQAVRVHLRSGLVLEGELRWMAPHGRQRTGDHLNDAPSYVAVYAHGQVSFVAKAAIAIVEEA